MTRLAITQITMITCIQIQRRDTASEGIGPLRDRLLAAGGDHRGDREPEPRRLRREVELEPLETRCGSVEMISSSKPWMLIASWIAASGSGTPIMPSTGAPAARSSSGIASSSVVSASFCA